MQELSVPTRVCGTHYSVTALSVPLLDLWTEKREQGTVNQTHTLCSDIVPWEPHEGPTQCFHHCSRWAPAKLPVRGTADRIPESLLQPKPLCQSWHRKSSSQGTSLTVSCSTPHPSPCLCWQGWFIYQGRKKRERSCSPAAARAPLHSPVLGSSSSPSLQLLSPTSQF